MNYDIGKLSLKELRKKLNDEVCPEKVAGVSYIIPPKYHIESRGVLYIYKKIK
jgi:hypothetical protein